MSILFSVRPLAPSEQIGKVGRKVKLATKGNYYAGPEEPRLRHLGLLFFLWP